MSADLPLSTTARTTLHRLSERGRTERADLYAVLDAGLICHLGVIMDGYPVVLPTGYGREDDTLYLHGSSANQALRAADGHEICVTVTHLDGLVCARSLFNHSINYRSAAIFGTARLISDDARKLAALRVVTEQLAPGRGGLCRAAEPQGAPPHGRARAAAGRGVGQGAHRRAPRRRRGLRPRRLGRGRARPADVRSRGAGPRPAPGREPARPHQGSDGPPAGKLGVTGGR